jgi:hypothetical protein
VAFFFAKGIETFKTTDVFIMEMFRLPIRAPSLLIFVIFPGKKMSPQQTHKNFKIALILHNVH